MKKILIFAVFFIASLDSASIIKTANYNIRATPIITPIILALIIALWGKSRYRELSIVNHDSARKLYFLSALLLTALAANVAFVSLTPFSSKKIYIIVAFNLAYFFFANIAISKINSIGAMLFIVSLNVHLVFLTVAAELLLASFGLHHPERYGIEGWRLLGRPTAFFDDPGWIAIWILGLTSLYLGIARNYHSSRKITLKHQWAIIISALSIAIANQSRALLLFLIIIVAATQGWRTRILLFYSALIIAVALIGLGPGILSENLYYDIVNIDRNPRLNDLRLISDVLSANNAWLFGLGLGSGELVNNSYPWRNMASTHNVLPLSLLMETGLVGLTAFTLASVFFVQCLKTREARTSILLLFIAAIFHNPINKHFFWALIALAFWADAAIHRQQKIRIEESHSPDRRIEGFTDRQHS